MAARIQDDDDLEETHEINVTPFIDVMLVLLIIFMVAAPLSTVDIPIDLPAASAKPPVRPEKPTFVTIRKNLTVALGEVEVPKGELTRTLDATAGTKKGEPIFLRADKTVPYGTLMEIMNALRAGGYLKVALVGQDAGEAQAAPQAIPSATGGP